MPLVPMREILINARRGQYAVGAFEFWSLDSAMAVVEAAQSFSTPVILQAGKLEYEYAGGISNLVKLARMAADAVSVSVALHLDHAEDLDDIAQAIDSGFTSVMFDGSHLPFEENIAMTQRVVSMAHPSSVTVEAELGRLAGAEGYMHVSEAEVAQTDPDEAARFVELTMVDALAVAIGTAHGFYRFPPKLNLDRLARIALAVKQPLVLHGGSGTPDGDVCKAIELGIAKVNICTEFIAAYGNAAADKMKENGFRFNVTDYFGSQKSAGSALVADKIKLFLRGH